MWKGEQKRMRKWKTINNTIRGLEDLAHNQVLVEHLGQDNITNTCTPIHTSTIASSSFIC